MNPRMNVRVALVCLPLILVALAPAAGAVSGLTSVVPECEHHVDEGHLAAGVSCTSEPPPGGGCTMAQWGIHEPWLTLGGGHGCHAMVAANGTALAEEQWASCWMTLMLPPQGITCQLDPPFQDHVKYPAEEVRCGASWGQTPTGLIVPTGAQCTVDGEPVVQERQVCTIRLDLAHLYCQAARSELECAITWGGAPAVPTKLTCTGDAPGLWAGCSAGALGSGWVGATCSYDTDQTECLQVQWGIHTSTLIVGGGHGCNVVVAVNTASIVMQGP